MSVTSGTGFLLFCFILKEAGFKACFLKLTVLVGVPIAATNQQMTKKQVGEKGIIWLTLL